MKISDTQARIAKELVEGPKSLEELANALGSSKEELEKELESLLKLGLVRKTKQGYRLAEAVRRGLMEGIELKPEDYKFRAYVIVEGVSEDKAKLEELQKKIVEKFKNDPYFQVIDLNIEETLENEGVYTSMFEAEVVAKSFEDLVYLVINYGPSSIELIEPGKFELKASEAQGILVDVANMIHAYTQVIADYQKRLAKAGLLGPRIKLDLKK